MLISFRPIQTILPDSDCAEISLFGPGIGECVVLHYGDGQWFIIDSCLCPETKKPVALIYLNSIGVDVSTQVRGILITHWHSDHIAGAYDLLKSCKAAKLYQSAALSTKEAYTLAALFKKDVFAGTDKGIREYSEITQYLFEKKDRDRLKIVNERHTFFDWQKKVRIRMVALSPSNTAVTQSIARLVEIKEECASARLRNVLPTSENLNAVAIHFTFGDFSAIFGSDLEEARSGNDLTGWSAILKNGIFNDLNLPISSLFKVPHHGSKNGHHNDVWSDLLDNHPLSITTAYASSDLPTKQNIDKIKELSSEFIVTRDPHATKKIKRNNMVSKELKAIAKSIKIINKKMGHIQVRISSAGQFDVALNDNCMRYSK